MTLETLTGRAIVTYGRSLMAVVIAHSLNKRGVEVISCDSVGMTAAKFSKSTFDNFVHADPDQDEDAYFSDLLAHIQKFKPEDGRPYILIPGFRDAKLLSQNADKFEGLITLAAPDFSAIDQIDPKDHLVKTLENRDVAAPKTFLVKDSATVKAAVAQMTMPALVKAVDEVGGRGIDFFDDKEALLACALRRVEAETPPPLLQEAAAGSDYCLAVLYDKGRLVAHMAYHNIQNMPSEGGAGAMRETIDDAPFLKFANALMAPTQWTGVAEIDFMWTGKAEDPPLLIEVNPRFWAGLFQSVESGVDFPWMLYQLFAFGTVTKTQDAQIGTTTKIPGVWAAGALSDALKNEIDFDGAGKAWSHMLGSVKDGEYAEATAAFKTAFSKITDFDDALALLKRQNAHSRRATSELRLSEDPMSSLGVFFVLSSLLRHGKLPPEVTE